MSALITSYVLHRLAPLRPLPGEPGIIGPEARRVGARRPAP